MLSAASWHTPLDYRHCDRVVTLYHPDHAARTVTRAVVRGAYLDDKRVSSTDRTGTSAANRFLLILPECHARFGVDYTLAPLDKVLLGAGPVVEYDGWASFIPSAVEHLSVVKYVDEQWFAGARCHVEAGGWYRYAYQP